MITARIFSEELFVDMSMAGRHCQLTAVLSYIQKYFLRVYYVSLFQMLKITSVAKQRSILSQNSSGSHSSHLELVHSSLKTICQSWCNDLINMGNELVEWHVKEFCCIYFLCDNNATKSSWYSHKKTMFQLIREDKGYIIRYNWRNKRKPEKKRLLRWWRTSLPKLDLEAKE